MQELKLIDVKIEKISFENNIVIPGETTSMTIDIETNISSIVKYDENSEKCKCLTTVKITPKMDVNFAASLCISGVFGYNHDDDQKEIHIAVCKKLFPYVQSYVASFMTIVGFPNFVIEEPEVGIHDVQQNRE